MRHEMEAQMEFGKTPDDEDYVLVVMRCGSGYAYARLGDLRGLACEPITCLACLARARGGAT